MYFSSGGLPIPVGSLAGVRRPLGKFPSTETCGGEWLPTLHILRQVSIVPTYDRPTSAQSVESTVFSNAARGTQSRVPTCLPEPDFLCSRTLLT